MSADIVEPAKGLRISNPIAVASVLSAVVALSAFSISWMAIRVASDENQRSVQLLLQSELAARKDRVSSYLDMVARDLQIAADAHISKRIMNDFSTGFAWLGDSAEAVLQKAYISDNPNPVGRKQALLAARDDSRYSKAHAEHHGWFRNLTAAHDIYDLFLVSPEGDVLYTVRKEKDFASNLLTGKFVDTKLADAFRQLREDPLANRIVFTDFIEYEPSDSIPAAFLGTPLLHDGEFYGALLIQLKTDPFNKLMSTTRMLNDSGSAYLVGRDRRMRSTSRFVAGTNVLNTRINSPSVTAAFDQNAGVHATQNHRGVAVLSAYAPFTWRDVTWAVLVEIEQADVDKPGKRLFWKLLIVSCFCILLAFVLGWMLAERREHA